MKRFLLLALCCVSVLSLSAADKKAEVSLYGFVTNQMYWQDRQNFQANDGLLNFFPKDVDYNDKGEDLNAQFNMSMMAINSRLGVILNGPQILGANASALVEADFSSAGMLFFLRQGYIKFEWDRNIVLFGQTGHPMCTDMMPGTINIAVGSPFNPLNRSPMLRYDHRFGENKYLTLTGAAIYQYVSGKSTGPEGMSNIYQRNCGVPELWAGLNYTKKGFTVEGGFDWEYLKPRTTDSQRHKVDEHVTCWSAMLQVGYNKGRFNVRAKTLYGYNMSHLNLASGYGVSAINSDGSYEYAPLKATSSWVFVQYGRRWKVGLLGGFMKNLGADKDLVNPSELLWVYSGNERNIDLIYRVCPQIEFFAGNFSFGLEYEMTAVDYGNTINSNGTVSDTYNVRNNRLMLVTKYSF
ncbi:MAG: hypothetical protein MJY77_05745 [Bacteroidaceae bacterium]|nr:hypothetical protein [Bacteroidaceae bacterium]